MSLRTPDKWDIRFLELAKHVSEWSKDPSTKVGAVVVDDRRIVASLAYNGFPQGCDDSDHLYLERETKYSRIVHAECNALLFATRDLSGMTLYTWPFMPCDRCSGLIIQAGIKRVVAPSNNNPRWIDAFALSKQMFDEAGIRLDLYE